MKTIEEIDKIEFHELANIFPLMEGAEFDALVRDIKENGLIEPIYLYKGKIIDGRNRYLACQKAGVKPRFEEYTGSSLIDFVISKNLHRRHLNESQRGVIASKIANLTKGRPTENPQICGFISQPEASKLLNVSPRTIQTIKAVEREAPEFIEHIVEGKMSANEALKQVKKQKREEERSRIAEEGAKVSSSERWNVYHGDIRTIELNKQYDFIITDPPYLKEHTYIFDTLGKRATEWLKPNGLLIVICWETYVNTLYKALDQYLNYYWTICWLEKDSEYLYKPRGIYTKWKPILVYCKGDYKGEPFSDLYESSGSEKDFHDWQKNLDGFSSLVKRICSPGQSILDPFCGSGTTGVAALTNGCFFDGIDIDINAVNIAKARLASCLSKTPDPKVGSND